MPGVTPTHRRRVGPSHDSSFCPVEVTVYGQEVWLRQTTDADRYDVVLMDLPQAVRLAKLILQAAGVA